MFVGKKGAGREHLKTHAQGTLGELSVRNGTVRLLSSRCNFACPRSITSHTSLGRATDEGRHATRLTPYDR